MTSETIQLVVLGALSLAALWYWVRFLRARPARPPLFAEYGIGDATLATILGLWFVFQISQSFGRTFVVTGQVIAASILLYVLLVILIVGFLVGRNRNPVELFGLKVRGLWPLLRVATLSLLAALPIVYFVHSLTQIAMGQPENQEVVAFLRERATGGDRALMVVMALLAAPIAEETIFRGYLHGVLRQYGGMWCGLGVNSLLFAAVHNHLAALPGLFLLAVALTLVYERTRSLWAPIVMHSLFNLITVLTALYAPSATP